MGISAHPERLRHLKTYHMDDIVEILEDRLNKSEGELAQIHTSPPSAVSKLALVYSIMQRLQVTTVNYMGTNGGSTSAPADIDLTIRTPCVLENIVFK